VSFVPRRAFAVLRRRRRRLLSRLGDGRTSTAEQTEENGADFEIAEWSWQLMDKLRHIR
jgi:hypothetical protein